MVIEGSVGELAEAKPRLLDDARAGLPSSAGSIDSRGHQLSRDNPRHPW